MAANSKKNKSVCFRCAHNHVSKGLSSLCSSCASLLHRSASDSAAKVENVSKFSTGMVVVCHNRLW